MTRQGVGNEAGQTDDRGRWGTGSLQVHRSSLRRDSFIWSLTTNWAFRAGVSEVKCSSMDNASGHLAWFFSNLRDCENLGYPICLSASVTVWGNQPILHHAHHTKQSLSSGNRPSLDYSGKNVINKSLHLNQRELKRNFPCAISGNKQSSKLYAPALIFKGMHWGQCKSGLETRCLAVGQTLRNTDVAYLRRLHVCNECSL